MSWSLRSSKVGLGPRFFGVSAVSSPCSAALRHAVRCEEYRPSLRSSAPTSPGCVQVAASLTMRSRYSAVKRRRFGFDDTSVSLAMTSNMVLDPHLALDTKFRRADVSRHVGREGTASFALPCSVSHSVISANSPLFVTDAAVGTYALGNGR